LISSHVLDTALGLPARGMTVHLDLLAADGSWRRIATAVTNDDGRVPALADANGNGPRGQTCRLSFETGAYFAATGRPTFFPRVEVTFVLAEGPSQYHVPLLLSPFGYCTYRGS
jgi:5-hydroxyisourate hydrolase